MPRYLISQGYIPDTPTNRFVAEWIELAGTIYLSNRLPWSEPANAAAAGLGFVTYDGYVRGLLGSNA